MSITTTVPLRLSQVKPDFEAIVMQLQLYLSQKATWKDMLTSSTGQTLIEMMAAVGTFNQFAIESAAREAFLATAIRDSSIYALTRMLGVRITRKSPAGVDGVLSRTGDVSTMRLIPKFSEFDIDGRRFFNRDAIMFSAGSALSDPCVLYEGSIKTQTIPANSQTFREIYLNEPGFVVSNYDLVVSLTNPTTGDRQTWTSIEDGIWTASPGDQVYYDSTSGLGDTVLAFGDGYHGALPAVGYNIEITYVVTTGSIGNSGGAGLKIKSLLYTEISGITNSPVSAGADEKAPAYYKALAPNLYKARTRAVTGPDYKAIASAYPGMSSVTVQAQRDIAPKDLRWMNVVRICGLPEYADNLSPSEWSQFLTTLTKKNHAAIHVQSYDPIKLYAEIYLTIAMQPAAIAAQVVADAGTNIRSLFAKDLSTLGKRIAVSDIIEACKAVTGVDYVDITAPLSDFVCPSQLHYYELKTLSISTKYSERTFYNVQTFIS